MGSILFTGASGFVGSNFIRKLQENFWFGDSEKYILTSRDIIIPGFHTIKYESFSGFGNIFPTVTFDIVFHIGAFTPKDHTESNLIDQSISNILFTQHLLTTLTKRCKKLIYLSTLDVYALNNDILSEESPILPISLYGNSKFYCEKLVEVWSNNENCPYQILRLGHIYGPGEYAYKKIIPQTISNILNRNCVEIWGEGKERRSFLYIDDCALMIYKASQLEESVGPINLASAQSITIKELISLLISLSNQSVNIVKHDSNILPRNITFDVSKMKKFLGYDRTSLVEGLKAEFEYCKILLENGRRD